MTYIITIQEVEVGKCRIKGIKNQNMYNICTIILHEQVEKDN